MLISCDKALALSTGDTGWPGARIHVMPPIEAATTAEVAQMRATGPVFEFTETCRSLTLLREVLTRLDRHHQFTPDSLLFSRQPMTADDIAALAQRVADDPWLIEYTLDDESEDILQLVLGANVTSNDLFIHFFRNLQNTDQQEAEPVLQALKQYLGKPENEGGAEQ